MNLLGLTDKHYSALIDILKKYSAGCKITAFGSRVTGKHNELSDLDLLVETSDNSSAALVIGELREKLEASDIPIRIDLVDKSVISKEFEAEIFKNAYFHLINC